MDRKLWTQQEDQAISRLVQLYGTKKWTLISQQLPYYAHTSTRSGKQCRQRWYNHLDPQVNKEDWTQQEQRIIFEAHKQHGNKWKQISKLLNKRTDNSIKNHFYSTLRRSLRRLSKFLGSKNSTSQMRDLKPCVLSKLLSSQLMSNLDRLNIKDDMSDLASLLFEFSNFKPIKQKGNSQSTALNEHEKQHLEHLINKIMEINDLYENQKNRKPKLKHSIHSERTNQSAYGESSEMKPDSDQPDNVLPPSNDSQFMQKFPLSSQKLPESAQGEALKKQTRRRHKKIKKRKYNSNTNNWFSNQFVIEEGQEQKIWDLNRYSEEQDNQIFDKIPQLTPSNAIQIQKPPLLTPSRTNMYHTTINYQAKETILTFNPSQRQWNSIFEGN